MKVAENNRAKVLWDFMFQTDRQLLASQPDTVLVEGEQKTAVVIHVAIQAKTKHDVGEVEGTLGTGVEIKVQSIPSGKRRDGDWLWQILGTMLLLIRSYLFT